MSAQSKLEKFQSAQQKLAADSPARQRIAMLCDPDSFVELDGFATVDGEPSGVVCGFGAVMGSPVYVFVQDSTQSGGAVGAVHAAKISKVYDLALKTGAPVVGIYDSNGAKVSEGVSALNAYGNILSKANNLSGVVPQIALVLGTCAGVNAMLAGSADLVVMSKNAEFFMSPGPGNAETAAKAGIAQIVCDEDKAACEKVRRLISLLPLNNLSAAPVVDFAEPSGAALASLCASVETACVKEIAENVVDAGSAVELLGSFGSQAYTAIATMGGSPCGVVATVPGKLDADSSAKIAKVVSVCDSFQIPVLTFVNTTGFDAEDVSSVRDMARLAHVYAEATTAKISVITGEAYGAAYVALCSAAGSDYTVAWPSATISALPAATAVAFLKADEITADKTRAQVEADYAENEASALAAAAAGAIDDVIDPTVTRPAIMAALDILSAKRVARNPKKHSNIPM